MPDELSMSQRCSWLYLIGELDFVRSLAQLSEAVYTPGSTQAGVRPPSSVARERLVSLLSQFKLPSLAYLPVVRSSAVFCEVVRIPAEEVNVFVTRARASVMLPVEVVRDRKGRKLSQLFKSVRTDRAEEVVGGLSALPRSRVLAVSATPYAEDVEDELPHALAAAAAERGESAVDGGAGGGGEEGAGRRGEAGGEAGGAETQSGPSGAAASGEGAGGESALLETMYGETWEAKKARVRRASPLGRQAGWDLIPVMSKANDDVRQETFVMQLVTLFSATFPPPLWLRPYTILSTGPRSGLIEMVPDTQSLDRLKRTPSFLGLPAHFVAAYGPEGSAPLADARLNFAGSLAAYSIVCYLLAIKDRHNGNLLIDRAGHIIHIDFGFVLGKAPGGRASLEAAVPFKLTREMVDVMGGADSALFREKFVGMCTDALLAARRQADTLVSLVEITMRKSSLPCFEGAGLAPLQGLRERLLLGQPDSAVRPHVEKLIALSHGSAGTWAYDRFQKVSNGIAE